MKNGRRKFTGKEKMVILRRYLVDKVPVSEVCEKHGFQPALFLRFGRRSFSRRGRSCSTRTPPSLSYIESVPHPFLTKRMRHPF